MHQNSVNLIPCSIKHRARSFGTKISSLNMCRLVISLSKITHQMWHDHPFSQRSKAIKRASGLEDGGEGRQYKGVFIK